MSVNSSVYSGKEFALYIAPDETTVGTFNTTAGDYKKLDLDSMAFPNFNPTQEFEMRTGTGRIASQDSMFTTDKGVVREATMTGRLTDDVIAILLPNVLGKAATASEIAIPNNHSPETIADGDSIVAGNAQTLSLYFYSPVADEGIKMSGCVCTSFEISADMGSASGRFTFTATVQTGYMPVKEDLTMTSSTSTTKYYLSDMVEKTITDSTEDWDEIEPLIKTLAFKVNGSAQMLGMQGTNGDPEVIARQVPELEVTYDLGLKYDDSTAPLIEEYRKTDQNIAFYISDDAENDDTFGVSASGLGIDINQSVITAADFDGGDIAGINLSAKVTAGSTPGDEAFAIRF
jgi:hypothetical protein